MAVEPANATKELTVADQDGKSQPSTFKLTDDSLYVKRPSGSKWPEMLVPLRHVVWAEVAEGKLEVSVLAKKKGKKGSLALVHIAGSVPEAERENASAFMQAVMDAAYKGVKRQRNVLVLVNPISGPGKSRVHLAKKILPVLKAAHCTSEVILTTHYKHAWEIAKELPLGKYDAIAAVSGDGIIHELLNGFAEHKDPLRALNTPLAPIPAGSANALSLNLLGLEEGFDISAATLNAVKGSPMPIDICSVTQKDKRVLSFLSQAIGLMADLDLGTEHLRFMGDGRFIYGYLRGLVRHKSCPAKISIKVAESDKTKMLDDLRKGEAAAAERAQIVQTPSEELQSPENTGESGSPLSTLPPLVHTVSDSKEGWIEFDKPLIYLMAGKGPLVGRDLMQFPMSLPDDGVVDVVIQERSNRKEMLKAMDGAELGRTYWMDTQRYYKAFAFRVEPTANTTYLSVDGEAYPFEPFAVEVHKGLATLLSPYGVYNVKFNEPDTRKKA